MGFNLDDYTPVSERIKQFWLDHPNGAIHSDLIFDDGSRCIIKTTLYLDKTDPIPTTVDYAEELISEKGVNSTSRIENCCTSSQGRSLAAAGYLGADWTKKPSREEMQKVVRLSGDTTITEPANKATDKQLNMIRAVCKSKNISIPQGIQGWTVREASQYIDQIKNPQPNDQRMSVDEEPF